MNNYFQVANSLTPEETNTTRIEEREAELVRIIEAIREVEKNKGWRTLKEIIFSPLTESLKKDLLAESRKDSPDLLKLSKISGQLKWAERYSDLSSLEGESRMELSNLRKLHG